MYKLIREILGFSVDGLLLDNRLFHSNTIKRRWELNKKSLGGCSCLQLGGCSCYKDRHANCEILPEMFEYLLDSYTLFEECIMQIRLPMIKKKKWATPFNCQNWNLYSGILNNLILPDWCTFAVKKFDPPAWTQRFRPRIRKLNI